MLYVVERLGEVGVMKLEKILYLADLEYYTSGAQDHRREVGPSTARTGRGKTVLP